MYLQASSSSWDALIAASNSDKLILSRPSGVTSLAYLFSKNTSKTKRYTLKLMKERFIGRYHRALISCVNE